jgi:hypothetical protein
VPVVRPQSISGLANAAINACFIARLTGVFMGVFVGVSLKSPFVARP